MAGVQYREMACKSALIRVEGMAFRWSLNPYRGCVHQCHYCFARPTHRYFDLGVGEDFSGIVFVKPNLPEILTAELARDTWRQEQVAVGAATDPYQPIEARYRLTLRALELFARFRTPISVVTKGTLILRDLDLLQTLTERAGASICFSVPTLDQGVWRRTEPGTPPPAQRLKVMERLAAAGINAGILMAPLLPGLSARPDQIARTVRAAADHGARFVGSNVLHLSPDLRDYFFGFLQQEYPALLTGYRRLYGTKYAPKPYRSTVDRWVHDARASIGYDEISAQHRRIDPPPPLQPALPLFAQVAPMG